MRKTILSFVSEQMLTSKERDEVKPLFNKIDVNHDGVIRKDEFVEAFTDGRFGPKSIIHPVDAEALFKKIDLNGDKQISFSEFAATALGVKEAKKKENLDRAFNMFDADGNGELSQQEICNVLKKSDPNFTLKKVTTILNQMGHPGHKALDRETFRKLFRRSGMFV